MKSKRQRIEQVEKRAALASVFIVAFGTALIVMVSPLWSLLVTACCVSALAAISIQAGRALRRIANER